MNTLAVIGLGVEVGRWGTELDQARTASAFSFDAGAECPGGLDAAVSGVVGAAQAALTALATATSAVGAFDVLSARTFQEEDDALAGAVPHTGVPK
ncbi:hypothetical protein CLV37_102310 [Kineococcus rhizosphaerae]|uniref:Uncharacterized protein n=2 Tax=Kineococcus rhizosphaerae TaxID=559628 RepID=A0A2T0R854_9ACTN|nr:hypothetical protein CLV37_102310 [Kineococcus rhizosphaerae]